MSTPYRGTGDELLVLLGRLLNAVTSANSNFAPETHKVMGRVANAMLGQVQQDFLTKSRGQTGRDGEHWPPVTAEAIAGRAVAKMTAEDVAENIARTRRTIFEIHAARLQQHVPAAEARRQAGRAAEEWATARRKELAGGVLDAGEQSILIDTGDMLRSFTPGAEDQPSGADGQVFEVTNNRATVGSTEKPWHQDGDPPRRQWPADGGIPAAWWPPILSAAAEGVTEAMKLIVQHGKV